MTQQINVLDHNAMIVSALAFLEDSSRTPTARLEAGIRYLKGSCLYFPRDIVETAVKYVWDSHADDYAQERG